MREQDPPPGWRVIKSIDRDGGTVFRRSDDNGWKPNRRRRVSTTLRTTQDWQAVASGYAATIEEEKLEALSRELGVIIDSLRRIGVGWTGRVFSFPEKRADGHVVGIATRAPDGTKSFIRGGHRGLVVPDGLADQTAVVLLVEGPTDVAACLSLGVMAVGRPSNRGGGGHIGELLEGYEVIVVGERDDKPGGSCPGRDGAKGLAGQLANKWRRPIRWAMPPAGAKDVRSWLQAEIGLQRIDDEEVVHAKRQALLEGLTSQAETVEPIRNDDNGGTAQKKSIATQLVELVEELVIELFHDTEKHAYATIEVDRHRETYSIGSRTFKQWMCRGFWSRYRLSPNTRAVADATAIIEANALYEGKELATHVRIADHSNEIWIDLGDDDWRAVRVTRERWDIVTDVPVKFTRRRGMLALPVPDTGGSLKELRRFVNVRSDDDFIQIVSWLVAASWPIGPFPVLAISGEQGSAKSTLARVLRAIVDPNSSPLRAEPREVRDLMIAATNSRVVSFDNLSRIPPWLSDTLCRLATGGGFSTRELYSNNEEMIFDAMRPCMFTAIEDVATRGDLLDRCLTISLPQIYGKRRTEREFWAEFNTARPRILGALLSALVTALRRLDDVVIEETPRMADFATLIVAAEPSLPWSRGAFMDAYKAMRESSIDLAIEASPIGEPLRQFMAGRDCWAGTATELLTEICDDTYGDEKNRKRRDWPGSSRALSRALRRLAPDLRKVGLSVEFGREAGGARRRIIRIEKVGAPPFRTSQPSDSDAETAVSRDAKEGRQPSQAHCDRLLANGVAGPESTTGDGRDDTAGDFSSAVRDDAGQGSEDL